MENTWLYRDLGGITDIGAFQNYRYWCLRKHSSKTPKNGHLQFQIDEFHPGTNQKRVSSKLDKRCRVTRLLDFFESINGQG